MKPEDIFAGPIIRRAQHDLVVIWLATTKRINPTAVVRKAKGGAELGKSDVTRGVHVCENLWIYLLEVTPPTGKEFPVATLLEYSIAVVDAKAKDDHEPFRAIVQQDALAYADYTLPTFYLQQRQTTLAALYVSCRKPHDTAGGDNDAMVYGDSLIANNVDVLSVRPAVLCLTGDQIYADDVHDETFDAVVKLAAKLEGANKESLPKGVGLPGKGARLKFVQREASFTSGEAANHLVTFAEYAAMYGLVWNKRNWAGATGGNELKTFIAGLPNVRRLLANTPTYMIFDDHDVTDDWNLSLEWANLVMNAPVGRRIVTNALGAFWLFQGWGNAPTTDIAKAFEPDLIKAVETRLDSPELLDAKLTLLGRRNGWEFHTPTYPFIYFLDTRTARGHYDGLARKDTKAPAWLKSLDSWKSTITRINAATQQQGSGWPLVLVAPAPVWGFRSIDMLQLGITQIKGPYPYDYEAWAVNHGHFLTFMFQCGAAEIVLLSGDVHYAHTSTAQFFTFDSPWFRSVVAGLPGVKFPKTGSGADPTYAFLYSSKFVQLTASATRNSMGGKFNEWAMSKVSRQSTVRGSVFPATTSGQAKDAIFTNGELKLLGPPADLTRYNTVALDVFKPLCVIHQHINDLANVGMTAQHNIGYVQITGRKVENSFLIDGKKQHLRTFDFAMDSPWAPPPT